MGDWAGKGSLFKRHDTVCGAELLRKQFECSGNRNKSCVVCFAVSAVRAPANNSLSKVF